MAMIKPVEIAFDDINHIIIDISLVECHCVLFYIWVSECPNYRYNSRRFSHLVCTQKQFCRCEYRGDYSTAFCVFGPLEVPMLASCYSHLGLIFFRLT